MLPQIQIVLSYSIGRMWTWIITLLALSEFLSILGSYSYIRDTLSCQFGDATELIHTYFCMSPISFASPGADFHSFKGSFIGYLSRHIIENKLFVDTPICNVGCFGCQDFLRTPNQGLASIQRTISDERFSADSILQPASRILSIVLRLIFAPVILIIRGFSASKNVPSI